jgi:stage V sporulation protein G
MNITEIRVKMISDNQERLRAFCSVTMNGDFVVRDLKIIEGTNGPFLAMPSRKLADRCPKCGCKNHLRARYCNECGRRLAENRVPRDSGGRAKLHADIAHPINTACREQIQNAVIEAYQQELERAKEPGYQPPALDDDDEPATSDYDQMVAELRETASSRNEDRQAGREDGSRSSRRRPHRGAPPDPTLQESSTPQPSPDDQPSPTGPAPREEASAQDDRPARDDATAPEDRPLQEDQPPHDDRQEQEAAPIPTEDPATPGQDDSFGKGIL